jgi:asparagine synthase (glutamine-hydrolysing)
VKQSGTTVVQVGEGADENFLGYWWCEHYRQKAESVYAPVVAGRSGWRRLLGRAAAATALAGEDAEISARAEAGDELFWGGAVCWWGDLRRRLTPRSDRFSGVPECPVPGLLPDAFRATDSAAVPHHYLGALTGRLAEPEVLQKIPYMELKLRLPEHLLMRVDKLTMAHAVEARVPFLDHDVVEFARRLPPRYKLDGGVGKRIVKKVAEPYVDQDLIYRRKQGFGAPMEEWFQEGDFGRRCLDAFDRSPIAREGLVDAGYFRDLLQGQMQGRGGYSFHIWTVMNAVLWHASWVEGREDCL